MSGIRLTLSLSGRQGTGVAKQGANGGLSTRGACSKVGHRPLANLVDRIIVTHPLLAGRTHEAVQISKPKKYMEYN